MSTIFFVFSGGGEWVNQKVFSNKLKIEYQVAKEKAVITTRGIYVRQNPYRLERFEVGKKFRPYSESLVIYEGIGFQAK